MKTEICIRTTQACSFCNGTGKYYNQQWLVFAEARKVWEQKRPTATQEQKKQFESDYWEAQGFRREPGSQYVEGP